MKKLLVLASAGASAAALVAVASAGAEGKPSYGCSAGFDHHVTTLEATFLPRSAKAIEDGLISRPDLQAVYSARFDHNGNDMVCVKEVPGWEVDEHTAHKPGVEYFYNFVDDASSSSNGQSAALRGAHSRALRRPIART